MNMLAVLNNVKERLNKPTPGVVANEGDFRQAYLLGLAMLAYADGKLDPKEKELYLDLSTALDVDQEEGERILEEGKNPTEDSVLKVRNLLVNSRFKYYFVIDMQIMAHQDAELHPSEKEVL